MKRITIALSLILTLGPAHAGLFKNSVDLMDLGELPVEALDTLQEPEFQVFKAEVFLGAAKAAESRAAGAAKAAGRMLRAEELDLKAAQAETKATKANKKAGFEGVEERKSAAAAALTLAELDRKAADALVRWKEQEEKAAAAAVQAAKSALDLAEAQRDLARVQLLVDHELPAAAKYDVRELEEAVRKRTLEFDKASRTAEQKAANLANLKAGWEALARNIELSPGDE